MKQNDKIEVIMKMLDFLGQDENLHIGDKFENISNSIIATRDSLAHGLIQIEKHAGAEIAEALRALENAIRKENELDRKSTEAVLRLLAEFTNQANQAEPSKHVLKSIGESIWQIVEKSEKKFKVAEKTWTYIEKLWT